MVTVLANTALRWRLGELNDHLKQFKQYSK